MVWKIVDFFLVMKMNENDGLWSLSAILKNITVLINQLIGQQVCIKLTFATLPQCQKPYWLDFDLKYY